MSVCDLSVVVPSYNSEKTIRRCLRSLAAQKTSLKFEVIVVDSSADGTADLVASEFAWVKMLCQAQRLYPGAARNIGIQNASGKIIAFLASDCVAHPLWLETRYRLHQQGFAGVGGAIANANPQSIVGWANYFMEFIFSLPGRPREEITGKIIHNLSYRREVFDRYGLFDPSLPMGEDTVFNRQMMLRGEPMIFEPEIVAGHINPTSLRELLVHHFQHGCHFAMACRNGQLAFFKMPSSLARRVLRLYQPLLFYPILRVKSCFANVVRHQPRLIPQLLLCFPLFLLGIFSAAIGIAVGSLR